MTNGDRVIQAALSPDGRLIATAGYFQGVKLWNAESGLRLPIKADHDQAVFTVAFSHDGRHLAYGGGRAFPVDNDMGSAWADTNNTHTTVSILDLETGARAVSMRTARRFIPCGSAPTVTCWQRPVGMAPRGCGTQRPGRKSVR